MNKNFKSNEEKEQFLEEKFIQTQEAQEAELLIDFDKCIEEEKEKPYKVVFEGKPFLVPRQMPFDFSIFFFRHCFKKIHGRINMNVPEEKMMEFIKLMFGQDMLRALETSKQRVGIDFVFNKLAMPIMDKWGYGTKEINQNNTEKKMLTLE